MYKGGSHMQPIKSTIAVLSSILLTVVISILLIISTTSYFFKTKNIQKTTEKVDVIHEINKIKNSSASGSEAEISDIVTMAYKEAENHAIPTKLVDEIFNSKEVKNFLGQIAGNTTDYIINDKKTSKVTSEDFNAILDQNIDKWITNSGAKISDSKKEVLLIRMKNTSKGIIDNLPAQDKLNKKIDPKVQKTIKQIFGMKTKIVLTIIMVILATIIIILKKERVKWIPYIITPLILSSVILISLSLILTDILTELFTKYNLAFVASTISNGLSNNMLIVGVIIIIATIPGIIYYEKKKNVN
jgi:hypothetical protein